MKKQLLGVILIQLGLLALACASGAETEDGSPQRVRIGVDVRLGFQACIDYWQPITEYLSKTIPECRFVIVPLASQQDLISTLENHGVDFLSLDPAMELMAEDRFGSVPLATMIEMERGETAVASSNLVCSGAILRRTGRSEIRNIQDMRGLRVSAVKPWSLTGWIAQWGLFVKKGIDPSRDFKQVVFEGTHGQVVKSVLEGTADIGVMDAEILFYLEQNQRIPVGDLSILDPQGHIVPLVPGKFVASTAAYPGRLVSKAAATSDELAKRVAKALMTTTQETTLDGMPVQIRWTVPSNYSSVRRLLQTLMGPQFAELGGYPMPWKQPAWIFPVVVIFGAMVIVTVIAWLQRNHYGRRLDVLDDQLTTTRRELMEVRAEKHRLDAILSLAGCGIDIVDDDDQIVYADAGIERRYGEWHGKKCYEYFCGADSPCAGCRRPGPLDDQNKVIADFDCSKWATNEDLHSRVHYSQSESTRMIGIPFRDESGRWMYARIHLPLAAFAESGEKATT